MTTSYSVIVILQVVVLVFLTLADGSDLQQPPLHKFSTVFTAQDVIKYLSNPQGIQDAMTWCDTFNIKKVYIESWRAELVSQDLLKSARDAFLAAGYEVHGCIATVGIGKPSSNWKDACCYTNTTTQDQVIQIFQHTAQVFDQFIIDDFFFTDCECSECTAARAAQQVSVAGHHLHYDNTTDNSCYHHDCDWADYRRNLMLEISRWCVLGAAKQVNPNVVITIKYPDWYDVYQDYGYDTEAQTNLFPMMWVGTEFRDFYSAQKPAYFAFFNMRWLGGSVGGDKCGGGGWYDPYQSTPSTYVEQARMTVVGGATESFLFEYGSLLSGSGKEDVDALLQQMPELITISTEVRKRNIVGVAAYKPTNSHGGCIVDPQNSRQCPGETYIFDFVGMLGIPLLPVHQFPDPTVYPSAFFSTHTLKDPNIVPLLTKYIQSGNPTLVTDQLKVLLGTQVNFNQQNVLVLPVNENPVQLLVSPPVDLPTIRSLLLLPLSLSFNAPVNTSFFPFDDGSYIVENFSDSAVTAIANGDLLSIDPRSWVYKWNQ